MCVAVRVHPADPGSAFILPDRFIFVPSGADSVVRAPSAAQPKRLAWRHLRQRQFVAVGFFGTVLTSPDAVTWTSRLPERDGILEDVAYGNGRFVAVGGQYDWVITRRRAFSLRPMAWNGGRTRRAFTKRW